MAAPEYLTIVELPVAGSGGTFEFNFAGGYLEREHVKLDFVSPLGVRTNYPLDPVANFASDFTLAIPVGDLPASDYTARIYRDTPRDAPLVNFTSGSRITERNLDRLAEQTIFAAAEAFDAGAYAVAEDLIGQALTAIEQTQALIDQAQGIVDLADASAVNAANSAAAAAASATSVAGEADAAAASADAAAASAAQAANSETTSVGAAIAAQGYANTASSQATAATNQATAAATSAANASSSAASAGASASAASTSATNAASSATAAAGSASAAATSASQVAATAANFPGRNKIINGAMNVAQRGTSFTNPVSVYTLDRWFYGAVNSANVTISQSTDVPAGQGLPYSLRVTVTTPDTAVAASDIAALQQGIEGFNIVDLVGRPFTLSFWVRAPVAGTYSVSLRNAAVTKSFVGTFTVTSANTWEKKVISVAGGLPTSGTWEYTTGQGLSVAFILMAGSNGHTALPNDWRDGNFTTTPAQPNALGAAGNVFAITGVQLEPGTIATPFEHRFYGYELSLCHRYFYSLPESSLRFNGYQTAGAGVLVTFALPVPMRITPTPTQPGSFNVSGLSSATLSAANNATVRVSGTANVTGAFSFENSGTAATVSAEL